MAKLAIYMNDAGDSVLHRTGFSWVAPIFPYIWALQHRLYKTCVATFVINTLLSPTFVLMPMGVPFGLIKLLSPTYVLMPMAVRIGLFLVWGLAAGFGANLYHRVVLERSGYFMTSAEPGRLKGG
jgi:hypothetical protein